MNKVWYPLKKEYPELNLKIECTPSGFKFTGNRTPSKYIEKLRIDFTQNDKERWLYVQSSSFPEIYDYPNEFSFFIGGIERNDNFEVFIRHTNRMDNNIQLLNKYFTKHINLNKQIIIL
jgi:hypothetical protein